MKWLDLLVRRLPPSALDRAREIAAAQRAALEEKRRQEKLAAAEDPARKNSNPDKTIRRRPIGVRSKADVVVGLSHYGWADQDLTSQESYRFYCGNGSKYLDFGSGAQPRYIPEQYDSQYPGGIVVVNPRVGRIMEWLPVGGDVALIAFRRIHYGYTNINYPNQLFDRIQEWEWEINRCILVSTEDIKELPVTSQMDAALKRFVPEIPDNVETIVDTTNVGLTSWGLFTGNIDDEQSGFGPTPYTPAVYTGLELYDVLPVEIIVKSPTEQKNSYMPLVSTPSEWLGACMIDGACDPVAHSVEFASTEDWTSWTTDIYAGAIASSWSPEPTAEAVFPLVTIPSETFPYPEWNTRWWFSHFVWDWNDPDYCLTKLSELGYTPEMLTFDEA